MTSQSSPFDAYLNGPQGHAVATTEGPLLVFAGAGSGKTRVITFRVANLVATQRVPPYRILCVTFTNKAAKEMRDRLEQLVGADIASDIAIGTFHATCARLLRRYAEDVGLAKNFVIYDDSDQRAVVTRAMKELAYDDKRFVPRAVLSRIMKEKQEGRGPDEMIPGNPYEDGVVKIFARYQHALKQANAVDFEDLLSLVMHLAESKTRAGDELRERFRYVLVDEFQDCNLVQYRLVRALAKNHENLCVVGDDDQAIYRWRGGDVAIIRGFRTDYPKATIVKLEENYRSSENIVRAALAVIKPSREREPKELFTNNASGSKVSVVAVEDERSEALLVVKQVKQTIAKGVEPRDIAVFYRIHAMSRVVEEVCRMEGVSYRVVGGLKFFDRAEVKDLLAYLRVLVNPRSDVDLLRIINVPARGIGNTTIEKLAAFASDHGTSVWDAVPLALEEGIFAGATKNRLTVFHAFMGGLRQRLVEIRPSELAEEILSVSGYKKHLEEQNDAESDARLQNMFELIGSLNEYEAEQEAAGAEANLEGYLERVTLSTSGDENDQGGKVSLMSIHGAKGLEFHSVFLLGMEEDLFPYVRRSDGKEEMDEEEERRLAYVALTRARKELTLLHVSRRTLFGNTRYAGPSRFLMDLPPEIVERTGSVASLRTGPPPFAQGRTGYGSGGFGGSSGGGYGSRGGGYQGGSRGGWGNAPPKREEVPRAPGERYVERDLDVTNNDGEGIHVRKGSKVRHARFGEGSIVSLDGGLDPSVTVNFPAWGTKKVLLRFLQPG
jgi:DNA helicase II / ATP-dependent DNA helicase PcrA